MAQRHTACRQRHPNQSHAGRGGGELPMDLIIKLVELLTALVSLAAAVVAAPPETHRSRRKRKGRRRKR